MVLSKTDIIKSSEGAAMELLPSFVPKSIARGKNCQFLGFPGASFNWRKVEMHLP